jgi:curli production assembly/transport component CsgF
MSFRDNRLPSPSTRLAFGALLVLSGATAFATELVYVPVNPSFGGSSLNGPALLNAAQAQNKHVEPVQASTEQTGLQQFNSILERSILSQLASAATSSVIGSTGKLTPGTVQTANFRINIVDLGGGRLQINTTDTVTGQSTSFQVTQ